MGSSLSLTENENDYLLDAIQQLKKTGLDGMFKFYDDMTKSWKEVPLKFAITGANHTRSSFMHVFLRFDQKDTKYTHPETKNVIDLCELPGLEACKSFRSFCKAIGGLEQYDAFLIFCNSPLTNHEKAMAEKLSKEFKKPFVFIKVDCDTINNENEHCSKNPKDFVKDGSDIYVIDEQIMKNEDRFKRLCEYIMSKSIRRRKQYFDRFFSHKIYNKEKFSQLDRLRAEIKYVVEKRGVDHIGELCEKLIELWSNAEVRVAVVGESGAGKSTFINAVRGPKGEVEELAETGVIETTRVPTTYYLPQIKEIMLCDLPGLGSSEFPNLQEYCVRFDLELYDAFLILSESRFKEHDKELAEKISKDLNKPFFFVRTHFKKNVDDNWRTKGLSEEETRKEVYKECEVKLRGLVHNHEDILFIDSRSPEKYDFQRLKELISEKLVKRIDDNEKDEEIIGLLKNETFNVIELKRQLFEGKVKSDGISLHVTYYFSTKRKFRKSLLDKVNSYRKEFGLDEFNAIELEEIVKEYKPNSSEENKMKEVAKNSSDFLKKRIEDAFELAVAKI